MLSSFEAEVSFHLKFSNGLGVRDAAKASTGSDNYISEVVSHNGTSWE
jgi:hypothetical protein